MPQHEMHTHAPGPHPLFYDTVVAAAVNPLMRFYDFRHEGAEVLQEIDGPALIAPVHRSMLDIPAVAAAASQTTGDHIHFMAKKELWEYPIIGWPLGKFIEYGAGYKIDRDSKNIPQDTIAHTAELVGKNALIGIFLEGTRKSGNEVHHRDLKMALMFAPLFGLTVVPVGVAGTEKGDRGPIAVTFGEPIPVDQAGDESAAMRRTPRLRKEVAAAMQTCQTSAVKLRSL